MQNNPLQSYRLGCTDIQIPRLGLGTVKLGRNQGVKYPHPFELPSDVQALALLNCARNLGITLIDTAPAYGQSEIRLGHLLYRVAPRSNWVIMTKVGEEFEDGASRFDFSASHFKFSIERSLTRLKTDHLDIVLVHSDGNDLEIIERYDVFGTLNQLKQQGYLRSYGMSTKTVDGGLLTLQHSDALMMTYNLQNQEEKALLEAAQAQTKGVFIKKALASGHLNNPKSALQFVLAEPAVSSVIVGTLNPSHLEENAQSL